MKKERYVNTSYLKTYANQFEDIELRTLKMRCPKRNLKKYSSRHYTFACKVFSQNPALWYSAYPSMLHTVTSMLCCRTYLFMSYKPFCMPTILVHHHSVFKQIRKAATEKFTFSNKSNVVSSFLIFFTLLLQDHDNSCLHDGSTQISSGWTKLHTRNWKL